MRLPWPAVAAGTLAVALGTAGLIRAAVPESAAAAGPTPSAPIVVTGAYIRPPLPPTDLAAAYFTIRNTTSKPDRLISVDTGAGATATLHLETAGGSMSAMSVAGAVIPAHGSLVLSVGKGHVMIGGVYSTLTAGDNVDIALQFANAGAVDVNAKVIPFGDPAPAGSTQGDQTPSGSTEHSSGAHQ